MDRRNFLRATTAIAIAGTAFAADGGLLDEAEAAAASRGSGAARYRGTRRGKIYVSHDDGRTWKLLTDFGPELAVAKVGRTARQRVVATMSLQGRRFNLVLQPDHRTWRTA